MKRYTPLLLTAFILFLLVLAGAAYLAGAGGKGEKQARQEITALTTLPPETASILSTDYERATGVRVHFVPVSKDDVLSRMKDQAEDAGEGVAALVLADSETLTRAASKGYLVPYLSETNDMIADDLRQHDGYWTGVWYDPIVFCVSRDYLKTQRSIPDSWQTLAKSDARVGITDFMAADASANLLYSMIAQYGDAVTFDICRAIHPRVVQYARYLANPVRQAGMGEVDIAIAVESETLRYIHDGYPLRVIYPADGTAAIVTGTGLLLNAPPNEVADAKAFADWLLTDEAQLALQSKGCFFIPTNPATLASKSFAGKNLVLFTAPQMFTKEQKKALLDRWAREVRFR